MDIHQAKQRFRFVLGAFLVCFGLVSAQPTSPFKELKTDPLPTAPLPTSPKLPEPFVDPNVKPTQQLGDPVLPGGRRGAETLLPDPTPSGPTRGGITATPETAPTQVQHPPTPVVRIQVYAPANLAPGKPVTYKIQVANVSQANAHRVQVRMPIPEGASQINKCEPMTDLWAGKAVQLPGKIDGIKELTWHFKTLARGESKMIDVEFGPAAGAKEMLAKAFVMFEHGEQVVTSYEKPKLAVKKTATPQVAQGDAVTVLVEVKNTSAVSIPKVRLVETASQGFEFRTDANAEKGEKANQRIWQLGTLSAGQAKTVTYQLLAKAGGDLSTTSHAASEDAAVASETAEAKTKVLVPGIQLLFTGPTEPVPARAPAIYEATVHNTGTLPLTDVRVFIPIPDDCELKQYTNGGQRTRDGVTWRIPKMMNGEAEKFRIKVEANASGKRLVRATARDGRGLSEETKEVTTVFQGRADLHWETQFSALILPTGKTGTITVTVKNFGQETAKAVRLRLTVPKEVKVSSTVPQKTQAAGDEIIFSPISILPGKSDTFTINFAGQQTGTAHFTLRLQESDTLGEKDLLKEQSVKITAGGQ